MGEVKLLGFYFYKILFILLSLIHVFNIWSGNY